MVFPKTDVSITILYTADAPSVGGWPAVAIDPSSGDLYVADNNMEVIQHIIATPGHSVMTTIAGNGGKTSTGDGGPALQVSAEGQRCM